MDAERIRQLLAAARREGRAVLSEPEALEVLRSAGVPVVPMEVARDPEGAATSAGRIGFPVILKVVSPDLPHKTEAGGVAVRLRDAEEVRRAASEMQARVRSARPGARLQGFSVQATAEGVETLASVTWDATFGPVLAFALGGVWAEVLEDVAFRLVPVGAGDVEEVLAEVKGARLLNGFRGSPPVDRAALREALLRLSDLAREFSEEIAEVEINPLFAGPEGVRAADGLIRLHDPRGQEARGAALSSAGTGFRPVLEPRSVAVVGASADPRKPGYSLLKNILDGGYAGEVYPINPRGGEILGRRAYPTVLDVPGEIDLVFFLLPREHVAGILDQCGKKGVKGAVIVTAGFGEVSGPGRGLDAELRAAIQRSGVRCTGPNTIGVTNAHRRFIASFVPFEDWLPGKVSIMAQTGNFTGCLANQIMDQEFQRLGIGKSVSVGNKVDLDEVDFLAYCRDDPETGVIGLYLESLPRARAFFSLAQEVKREKPIIVLKPGRTETGSRVSLSHTGALASDDKVFDAACRQYGVIRARTVQEFLALLKGFSFQPLPRGRRVALVSYSGGAAVIASDELAAAGLELPDFDERTLSRLRALMPEWQPVRNPVDLWPAMTGDNLRIQAESIRAAMEDANTDAVLLILLAVPNAACDGLSAEFRAAMDANPHKPILCLFLGGKTAARWKREMEEEGRDRETRVPVFEDSSVAVRVLEAMAGYAERRGKTSPEPQL